MVHEKQSINKYLGFSQNIFPLEEMGQKSTKLYVFSKRNYARLSAGRLTHQIAPFNPFNAQAFTLSDRIGFLRRLKALSLSFLKT